MIIIWRKWGILVPVLLFGGLIGMQLLVDAIYGRGSYTANSTVFGGLGLFLGGFATFLIGRWDDARHPAQAFIDKETGKDVVLRERSHFFFIPMRWCGMLGMAAGIGAFAIGIALWATGR